MDVYKDIGGQVFTALYECDFAGQWTLLSDERWGPFDTASDVAAWLVRHWAPRARLPLR